MRQKTRRFKDRLKEDLKNPAFRKRYEAYELPVRLAVKLARLRQDARMTQVQLARKIGVSQQFVARLENSRTTVPSLRTLEKVARALNRSVYLDFR
ncbi:MAG: helix-turn-helix transcriptional regulator [Elusimicrobia bacterium]|nr:helix-turn-helix transcriptional regulator [Elusimicrobiota bacterium]MDE2313609.1 helix-turn-helix transcriptional regulator [Elusimicrobiota bacterium]